MIMITNFYKTNLFISSFLPLYIILIIKFYNFKKSFIFNLYELKFVFLCFGILIMISIGTFLYFLFCELNDEESFGEVENVNFEILSYFITYIVPLTTLELDNINSIIINILLFVVIGFFYVNSNQFYLNILFTIFGFSIFKDNQNKIIISKKNADQINNKQFVKVKVVSTKVFIINNKNQ